MCRPIPRLRSSPRWEENWYGVHFTEGQDVKIGDLLFTIDPRPYEAALKQAEANLERDLAQAKHAREDARRYESLIQKGVVPQQQYDKFRTDADALEATVLADRAAVENAKIQLGYCSIHSPIDGRTGSLIVQQGNHIKAEDINLVVINQIVPIDVAFSVPEQFLSEIKKHMALGKLQVEALVPMDDERPERGVITFVDNAVDTNTGTIRLKGTFANREKKLWPGQFVNVVLTTHHRAQCHCGSIPGHRDRPGRTVHLCGQGGPERRVQAGGCGTIYEQRNGCQKGTQPRRKGCDGWTASALSRSQGGNQNF